MVKLVAIIIAVAVLAQGVRFFSASRRENRLAAMSTDELIDAVLRHEITLAEVPLNHREEVGQMLDLIQFELKSSGRDV